MRGNPRLAIVVWAARLGEEDESPPHLVHVDGFWLDCLEVTNAGFREFIQKTGYRANAEVAGWGSLWRNRQWTGVNVNGLDWRHCGAYDLAGNVWERDND